MLRMQRIKFTNMLFNVLNAYMHRDETCQKQFEYMKKMQCGRVKCMLEL